MSDNIFRFKSKGAKDARLHSQKHDDCTNELRAMANRLDEIAETMELKNWLKMLGRELRKIAKFVEKGGVEMVPAKKQEKAPKAKKRSKKLKSVPPAKPETSK